MITGEQLKAIQNHNQIAIRNDDGEWEILGNINTFEMSCECGEIPTINIEISQNHIYTMPTPDAPLPINFPKLGEWDLYTHHDGCDISCDSLDALRYAVEDIKETKKLEEFLNKKEGKDMKLLNMYVEKSEKNIKDYYEKLLDEEYNNREVVKEFEDLCNKFQEDLAKLAEKTANDDVKLIELDFFESGYGIECNPTKEEQEIREKLSEELRNLHDKIDEVNAQLEIIGNDENSSHHDVNYVLHNYDIIDENNKLTPYTPIEKKKAKK